MEYLATPHPEINWHACLLSYPSVGQPDKFVQIFPAQPISFVNTLLIRAFFDGFSRTANQQQVRSQSFAVPPSKPTFQPGQQGIVPIMNLFPVDPVPLQLRSGQRRDGSYLPSVPARAQVEFPTNETVGDSEGPPVFRNRLGSKGSGGFDHSEVQPPLPPKPRLDPPPVCCF